MSAYGGTDNLEAMQAAENYNRSLVSLVENAARNHASDDLVALDFGAGIGTFAKLLSPRFPRLICLEPDDFQHTELCRQGFESYKQIDDIPDGSVDFIYSLNVLEHVENDAEVLAKLCGKLKDDGTIFIYVPAFQVLFTAMDRKVGHFRRYSSSHLASLLESSKLEVVSARYADSLGFFATIAYKLVGSSSGDLNPTTVRFYDRFIFPVSHALDHLVGRWFGKNVHATALKRAAASTG